MNKMKFMFDPKNAATLEQSSRVALPYKKFNRDFKFEFSADYKAFENVITDDDRRQIEDMQDIFSGRRSYGSSQIVKSDIKDNVLKQIKEMMAIIKRSGNELLYFKMNSVTKQNFRMYYNYEVDHIPKSTSIEDKFVGNIIGCMMGVKIVQDEKLKNDIVQPLIKVEFNGSMAQKLKKILT